VNGTCPGPWLQADASRRRNGPRKATFRRPITVRLRSKSCPAGGPDGHRSGRRGVVATVLRDPQQADVGSKTRSAGQVPPATPRRAIGCVVVVADPQSHGSGAGSAPPPPCHSSRRNAAGP
jgi:hypothetical protein